MSKVAIITDSTSCLPLELIKKYNIGLVSPALIINGKPYLDQVDITAEQFWELFKKASTPITTSAVTPKEFVLKFEEMKKTTNDILCIPYSKGLGATYQAALAARNLELEDNPGLNIRIVDSHTSAGALGFIILEAARAVEQNKNLEDILQIVNEMMPRVKFVTLLESMKYLIKFGRVSKEAEAAEAMGIKPFIGMVKGTGAVENLGGVPGKEAAMARLVDMVKEYADISKPLHVMVHYSDNIEDGYKIVEMVKSKYQVKELYMTPYTPIMACFSGPALTLAFYADK
jgi:DegV family protein with EDD domain